MESGELTKLRREATQKFLASYKMRKQLGEVASEDNVPTMESDNDSDVREKCSRLVRPFDPCVAAGQVRILSGVENIAYVLVARKWDADSWLIVPFSMYSSPATDTELQVKVNGGVGLRVLQLWNARSLLTQTLEKSWLVHTFSEEDLADALTAWQWSVGVGELSEDQLARTGMPIMRRDDPRVEYQDVSLANFAKIDAADFALSERQGMIAAARAALAGRVLSPFKESKVFEHDYALAAADAIEPVTADCKIEGIDATIHVRYAPASGELNVRVFDLNGSRTNALDGWNVFGTGTRFLGSLQSADFSYKFQEPFDGVLILVDEDGGVHPLHSATI